MNLGGKSEGVLVGGTHFATRRPATEQSEGALLGAPTKRVCGRRGHPHRPHTEMRLEAELLARRPGHVTAAEEVDVQMIDALTTVRAGVDHGAVSGFGDLFLPRNCRGERHHPAKKI